MVNLVLSLGVELLVTGNSVVENTSLGDLFRSEGLILGQVLAVIVTQMVVRYN